MRLVYIEIENHKSFWKNEVIRLDTGFNLFLGANNSGKTTALEVLDLNNNNEPHKSVNNLINYNDSPTTRSVTKASIATNLEELRKFNGSIYLPVPINLNTEEDFRNFYDKIFSGQEFEILIELNGFVILTFKFLDGFTKQFTSNQNETFFAFSINLNHLKEDFISPSNYGGSAEITNYYTKYLPYIYRFNADRKPASQCGFSDFRLARDASNLPYCINHLQTNDSYGHELLCGWVNKVFPNVKWIQSVPIQSNNIFELRCLPLSPQSERDDLAVPLSRMGSGIGNVIAIFYVIRSSRHPQVIAIDEPNSFLHPKALRELLQILSIEAKKHQVILTAHSADVITSAKPNLITMFELKDSITSVKQIGSDEISLLRTELSELGIRMTDLHGRDQVLWVEGQTEELVIPELLKVFCPEIAPGTAVLRVEHTGTFDKKGVDPSEVAKIYKRLTTSSALVPPMVAILLDRELHKSSTCTKLEKESKGTLIFLKRRMLENYILYPEAIAAILVSYGESVTEEQIKIALNEHGVTDEANLIKIDGAKILSQVFSEFSQTRQEFKKTRDVLRIISFLLENDPQKLNPLKDFLRAIFKLK